MVAGLLGDEMRPGGCVWPDDTLGGWSAGAELIQPLYRHEDKPGFSRIARDALLPAVSRLLRRQAIAKPAAHG